MRPRWSGLRRGIRNPIVCGRKFCGSCGRWRHVCDFPYNKRNGIMGLDSYCSGCQRTNSRRRWQDQSETARELRREYQRFQTEVRRREAGVVSRGFIQRRTVVDKVERVLLPPEPLLRAIRDWERQGRTLGDLAERATLAERAIHRIRVGESERVRLDVADKLAMALDIPLALLYPLDEAA